MKLSKYFTLEELTFSQTASRHNISNIPTGDTLKTLTRTAEKLDLVREYFGCPITVNSGFRCLNLNRKIGSKDTSQHVLGQAVDFIIPRAGTPKSLVKAIKDSNIEFDQIIQEFDSWVHISFKDSGNRKQALIIDSSGTRAFS